MKGTKYKPFYQHFLIAAGDIEGDYHGAQWNDGDFYKFLEAVCATYAVTRDPQLEAILDQSIDAIGRAQRADGYIHTPVLIRQRNGDRDAQPFQDRHNFEMYNMGHLITAACLHHRVTGRDEFLNIARKTADFLVRDVPRSDARAGPQLGLPVALHGDGRAVSHDARAALSGTGPEVSRHAEPGHRRRRRQPGPHSVRRAARSGRPRRAGELSVCRRGRFVCWKRATQRCGSRSRRFGKTSSRKRCISPAAAVRSTTARRPTARRINRTSRACTRPTAATTNFRTSRPTTKPAPRSATCCGTGGCFWRPARRDYVDVLELALYNAVLSGVSLDGTNYFYVNPLRQVEPLPTKLRWSRTRVPFVTSYCCPPNVLAHDCRSQRLRVQQERRCDLGQSLRRNRLSTTLLGKPLKLTQSTNYPWDGTRANQIDECPSDEFALKLRVPGWADSRQRCDVRLSQPMRTAGTEYVRRSAPPLEAGRRRRAATWHASPS